MHQIFKIILSILLFCLFSFSAFADQASFASWLENFKLQVQKEGVSQKTIKNALTDIKFLPKVRIQQGYNRLVVNSKNNQGGCLRKTCKTLILNATKNA